MQTLTPQDEGACVGTEMAGEQPLPICRTSNLNSPSIVGLKVVRRKSARGLAQSKTLARIREIVGKREASWSAPALYRSCPGQKTRPAARVPQGGIR